MKKLRNQSYRKQIEIRDMGLCRCCGFTGSEAHHIIPITYDGEDKLENMIWLCGYCHRDAPNTKQEFFNYLMRGGSKTERILGMMVTLIEERNLEFQKVFPYCKDILKGFRNWDKTNSLEQFNLKDSMEVPDVDFSKEIAEYGVHILTKV